MRKVLFCSIRFLLVIIIVSFSSYKVNADEIEVVLQELKVLQNDIKTLEKAVYNQDIVSSSSTVAGSENNNDVLTKHLLKLSELEEQFKILTNNFEEVNFKLDKLSSRITKIQKDNQVRFQDLETSGVTRSTETDTSQTKTLPGTGEAKDLGESLQISVTDSDIAAAEQIQKTQSIESVGTVITEDTARAEKILPDSSPEKQYEFAVSFIKVGDYETAEFALREF